MNCTQCGRVLDAQALELGACRYCGQAIFSTGTINISPPDTTGAVSPPTGAASLVDAAESRYDWKDWPTASALPPGATSPTLPKVGGFAEDTASGGTISNNALTLPGSRFFASPAEQPPGTAPYAASPLPGAPPAGASASPGPAAPQAIFIAPAANAPTPPRQPPQPPGRRGQTRLLALAGLLVIALVVLITGGFLFARSFFNKPSAGASATGVVVTVPATATPTARPTATAKPTSTSTPAPTATPTVPNIYTDPNGLFTINYPDGWTPRNTSIPIPLPFPLNGVQFSNSTAELTVATGKEPPGTPGSIATQADDLLLIWQGVMIPRPAQTIRIGGQNWTQKSGDTNKGRHIVVDSISHNGYLYSLIYGAPISEFPADDMQAFTPMIASFRFDS